MIRSMTGYGQARWDDGGRVVHIEVRTVNGKHFKLHPRIPHEFACMEHRIEKAIRKVVTRGSIDLYVRVQFEGARAARPVNKEALATYIQQLRLALGDQDVAITVNAGDLSSLPGVLESDELNSDEAEELMPHIQDTLTRALADLNGMRETEGTSLRNVLLAHCEAVENGVRSIEAGYPDTQDAFKERLVERVNRLLRNTDINVGERELTREIAIYAERSNVAEELARLLSHIEQFRETLDEGGPVGRRLEFLAQEMNREANTTGAKVGDVGLSRQVVDLHGEVNKIREQVLNVE
ncbi:YicC family protein [bacterium]|nr:YicC family protein [bacterium]